MGLADALLLPRGRSRARRRLKSPLFSLTEDELFALAWNRKGSLRDALTRHAAESGRFADALDRLASASGASAPDAVCLLRLAARRETTAARASCARLGHEANDALDEFLELALTYERKRRPRCRASWPGCARPTPR